MSPPFALQLACGWTRLVLTVNTAATMLLAPLIYVMSSNYGGVGAAMVWVVFNAGNVLVSQNFMHRRLLRGELWRWYRQDVGQPLLAAAAVGGLGKWLIGFTESGWANLANLMAVSVATFVAAIVATPAIRALATNWLTPARRIAK
jgi:hypothetical protein